MAVRETSLAAPTVYSAIAGASVRWYSNRAPGTRAFECRLFGGAELGAEVWDGELPARF
jgi:hypothetical protein